MVSSPPAGLTTGLFLSLLVLRLPAWPPRMPFNADKSTIEHLSVHTGEVIKAVPVPASLLEQLTEADWTPTPTRDPHFPWWPMGWGSGSDWPSHKVGHRDPTQLIAAGRSAHDHQLSACGRTC